MITRALFKPRDAEFLTSFGPQLAQVNHRPVLAFDDTADEGSFFTYIVPPAPTVLSPPFLLKVYYLMATAIVGTVGFQAQMEQIVPDVVTSSTALTANLFTTSAPSSAILVPAGEANLGSFTITLDFVTSFTPGNYIRFRLNRDADSTEVSDTAVDDCYIIAVEFQTN